MALRVAIKNYSIENVIARKFRESNKEVSDKLFRFKRLLTYQNNHCAPVLVTILS